MFRRLGRSKTLLVLRCGFVVQGHRHVPCRALQHDAGQQSVASVRRGIPRPPRPAASPTSGVALAAEVGYHAHERDNCAEMALGLCVASVPPNRRPSSLACAWGCAFPAVWHLAALPRKVNVAEIAPRQMKSVGPCWKYTVAASLPPLRRVLHRPLFLDHQDVFGSAS